MAVPRTDLATQEFGWLGRGPWPTFLYGDSRPVLLRVLYAMARANDPSPFWLQLRDASDAGTAPGPAELGWLDGHRLFYTDPEHARPQDDIGKLPLWTVIRPDESRTVVAQLTDFLRLPPLVQDLIGEFGGGETRHSFAIANSDRARRYYPRSIEGVRPVLDAMMAAGALPLFGATSPPGAGRFAFDCVFEVRAKELATWREGSLFCEKMPAGSPFEEGGVIPLRTLASLAVALDGSRTP